MEHERLNPADIEILESGSVAFYGLQDAEKKMLNIHHELQFFNMTLKPDNSSLCRIMEAVRTRNLNNRQPCQPFWVAVDSVEQENGKREIDRIFSVPQVTMHRPPNIWPVDVNGRTVSPVFRYPSIHGYYDIIRTKDHNKFVYSIDHFDHRTLHTEMDLPAKGSYVLEIKNPETGFTPRIWQRKHQRAHYPELLQQRFNHRPFISKQTHEYLNHKGTMFLMISATDQIDDELDLLIRMNRNQRNKGRTGANVVTLRHARI